MKLPPNRTLAVVVAVALAATPQPSRAEPVPPEPVPGSKLTLTIEGVEFTFCYIPAGSFMMGSPESEVGRAAGETLHKVTITRPFYMMEHEITQKQYEALVPTQDDGMQSLESHFKGDQRPRESICFVDSKAKRVWDRMTAATQRKFRLPTEAEWEYACRAGTSTPFHYGHSLDWTTANIDGHEPYGEGARGKLRNTTTEVKQFAPNAWGLYDMHGNVAEACMDYAPKGVNLRVDGIQDPGAADPDMIGMNSVHTVVYVGDPAAVVPATTKPQTEVVEGKLRVRDLGAARGSVVADPDKVVFGRPVFCGGGYRSPARECRSAARLALSNDHAGNDFCGFRFVLIP